MYKGENIQKKIQNTPYLPGARVKKQSLKRFRAAKLKHKSSGLPLRGRGIWALSWATLEHHQAPPLGFSVTAVLI